MVDYYEDLNLDESLSLRDIQKELSRLESIWKSRRTRSPEKAVKMLALIVDAREAFKTEGTRAAYDRDLEESKRPKPSRDLEAEKNAEFQKWEQEANNYFNERQYDLAKTAVEKAAMTGSRLSSSPQFCKLASEVYQSLREYELSLDYINKAILENPKDAEYELLKAYICNDYANAPYTQYAQRRDLESNAERSAREAIRKAQASNDTRIEGLASGYLAYYLYFILKNDNSEAEQLAYRGLRLCDDNGNAKRVINAIRQKRKDTEESAKRAAKAAEEAKAQARFQAKYNEWAERKRKREKFATDALDIFFFGAIAFIVLSIVAGVLAMPSLGYLCAIELGVIVGLVEFSAANANGAKDACAWLILTIFSVLIGVAILTIATPSLFGDSIEALITLYFIYGAILVVCIIIGASTRSSFMRMEPKRSDFK